jgi:hypothetical protein
MLLALAFVRPPVLFAQSAANAGDFNVETVLTGLKAPWGVAVRPDGAGGPTEVFVAERGAGRVVQVHGDKSGAAVEAIVGFPVDAASSGREPCARGVRTLFFLDHARLVAAGGNHDDRPLLRLYDFTESELPFQADQHKQNLELPIESDKSSSTPRCFHDLARTQANDRVADLLVAAATIERGKSVLCRVPVRANTLGEAGSLENAKEEVANGAVGGIAVGHDGYVVVAYRPDSEVDAGSQLKYVNPITGRATLTIDVKLPHITALAFHPTSRSLYAANLSAAIDGGGVYRIDDAGDPGKPAASAVKVAEAMRPTALAFAPDGALYVTALGSNDNGNKDSGALLKITGEL